MDDASTSASSPGGSSTVSELWCVLDPATSLALLPFLGPGDLAAFLATDYSNSEHLQIAVLHFVFAIYAGLFAAVRHFS